MKITAKARAYLHVISLSIVVFTIPFFLISNYSQASESDCHKKANVEGNPTKESKICPSEQPTKPELKPEDKSIKKGKKEKEKEKEKETKQQKEN